MSTSPIYLHLLPGAALPPLSIERPFRTVIAAESMVDETWMGAVCDWLIGAGCLYLMAWGQQGSQWDDAGDIANIEKHDYGEISDQDFVMTTWHDDQTLEEVLAFCHSAEHPHVVLKQILILHLSPAPDESAFLHSFASQIP